MARKPSNFPKPRTTGSPAAGKQEARPIARRVTSLKDVEAPVMNVEYWNMGELQVVSMRMLGHWEFHQLGYEVPAPIPPIHGVDDFKRPIFDTRNPTYLREQDEAVLLRGYVRLAAALKLPAEYADLELQIEGSTPMERVESLKKRVGMPVMNQWLAGLVALAEEGEAQIAGRAATFQG